MFYRKCFGEVCYPQKSSSQQFRSPSSHSYGFSRQCSAYRTPAEAGHKEGSEDTLIQCNKEKVVSSCIVLQWLYTSFFKISLLMETGLYDYAHRHSQVTHTPTKDTTSTTTKKTTKLETTTSTTFSPAAPTTIITTTTTTSTKTRKRSTPPRVAAAAAAAPKGVVGTRKS